MEDHQPFQNAFSLESIHNVISVVVPSHFSITRILSQKQLLLLFLTIFLTVNLNWSSNTQFYHHVRYNLTSTGLFILVDT